MSKNSLTAEKRIELAKEYMRGETSYERIAKKYEIGATTVKEIVSNAEQVRNQSTYLVKIRIYVS